MLYLLFPVCFGDLLTLAQRQPHHRGRFDHVAEEVHPDDAHEGVLINAKADLLTDPYPETAVQANGDHIQQNIHRYNEHACHERCVDAIPFQFLRQLDGVHRKPSPHKTAKHRKLLGFKANVQIEIGVVVVDVRHRHRQQFHHKTHNSSRTKGEYAVPIAFTYQIDQHDANNAVAHQFKCVNSAH